VAVALIVGAALVADAVAQSSGGPYDISKVAIAGGGGPISGGAYQITSTLGQPATAVLAANNYIIFDGFWSPVGGFVNDVIFADGFGP
jgi:hypothetical protein